MTNFNREKVRKSLEQNAEKQAYFAFLDEVELILPVKTYQSKLKANETPVLTVAGLVSLNYKLGILSEKQVKDFCRISGNYPEQATSLWASLPKVLDPEKCSWYKSNNRKFTVERDAVAFLSEFLTDEELDDIATATDAVNKELSEKAQKEQSEIDEAKALFN